MTMINDSETIKLFVGCQVTTVTEEQLRKCFSEIEKVLEVKICRDSNNFCKGYAFITISDGKANLKKALSMKASIEGRQLDVTLAHGIELRNSTIQRQKLHKIFVKNLPLEFNDKSLANMFLKFGKVKRAYVIYHYNTRISKRYGYVEFLEKESVDKAQEKNKFKIKGRDVIVSRYVPRSEQKDDTKFAKSKVANNEFKAMEQTETTRSLSWSDSDNMMEKQYLQHEGDDFDINNCYNYFNLPNQNEYEVQDQRIFNYETNQNSYPDQDSNFRNTQNENQYYIESNPQQIYYNDTNQAPAYQQPQMYGADQNNYDLSSCQGQNGYNGAYQTQFEQKNFNYNNQEQNSQFTESYNFNREIPQNQYANQSDSYYNYYSEQNQFYSEPIGQDMYSNDYSFKNRENNHYYNNTYEQKDVLSSYNFDQSNQSYNIQNQNYNLCSNYN